MTASPNKVYVRRVSDQAEPAAMVATWLLGELAAFDPIEVDLGAHDTIVFSVRNPGDIAPVRAQVAVVMDETRFANWELQV